MFGSFAHVGFNFVAAAAAAAGGNWD